MTKIEAIPTTYKGTQFRSRLEARFAEWLDLKGLTWIYEPPSEYFNKNGSYRPDFYLVNLELYVEVKPAAFISELTLHDYDIRTSGEKWICIDQHSRGEWGILDFNFSFCESVSFQRGSLIDIVPVGPRIEKYQHYYVRIFSSFVDVSTV
jgi:hypothetical protein